MNERPLRQEKYFQIAQVLMRAVCNLEAQGLAHCDLSNNNFIIDPTLSTIELIDIEDMYAPEMPRPIPDVSYGTVGYRTKWIAEHGLWGPNSDRFASAILCSEIITWHNKEIRDNKAGESSFFDEAEMGEDSDRYRLMQNYLGKVSGEFSILFEKAWFSKNPNQCPVAAAWLELIEKNMHHSIADSEKTAAEKINVESDIVKGQITMQNNDTSSNIKSGIPDKASPNKAKAYLLISFLISGLSLFLAIILLGLFVKIVEPAFMVPGPLVDVVNFTINIVGAIIYSIILTLLVGIIQLTIFRNRIGVGKLPFLFFLALGGGAGGFLVIWYCMFLVGTIRKLHFPS